VRPMPLLQPNVDVNGVVRSAVSDTPIPDSVGVALELDETLPGIRCDPDHLSIVFGNISLNAIQAMPRGGRLVVSSRAVHPEWVAVSFADTGHGISDDDLDRLFGPLFTTKAQGTGLGLSIAKLLVEGHGGSIEAQSQVGVGSLFTVRLPLRA